MNIFQYKFEVKRYFMEDVEGLSDIFHILTWWKVHSIKFSIIFQVTQDILVISTNTVDSKLAFRTSSHVMYAYKSLLAMNTMVALICTQNRLRWSLLH